MSNTRFTPWVVLVCMSALAACTSSEGSTAGNTELNVIVPNNESSPGVPAPIDIQSVEYTINCLGNSDTFLENSASFPDEVRLEGNLEVVDGQTSPQGPIPPEFGTPRPGDGAEIWQGFMDLPPGPCTIQLRARDNDGEVICTATEPFSITADTTAKVNLVLVCDVSYQAPVGMLDVDATFSFLVSNFCPDLFVLNCLDSNPVEEVVLPPPFPPIAATTCEVRFRDGDSQCGQSCDPQTCTVTPAGIDCVPGADPGVSTTVTCTGGRIDCDFDPITTETECTYAGDTLGNTPVGGPIVPNTPGLGGFAVSCIPPALGGAPGAVIECTAVTTDGDEDCNKTKTVQVNCPGLTPCAQFGEDNGQTADQAGGDAACGALLTTVCQTSVCDDAGGTGPATCVDSNVADGLDCSAENPPLAECQGGVCTALACTGPADCDDGNECTTGSCDVGTGICSQAPNTGASCQGGDGTCDAGGVCQPNNECTVDGDCPNTPAAPAVAACTAAVCNTAPFANVCEINLAANAGGTCDFSGPGSADGTCNGSGECQFTPPTCNFAQTGSDSIPQEQIVQVGCTNSVTAAQSPFPWTLSVDVAEPVIGGGSFDAVFDGIGIFPEFFLDAAQGVVNGGVQEAILEGFAATVQIRSGATGPDVELGADLGALVPGPTRFCNFPANQICTADGECLGGVCNPPVNLATIPTSSDCSPGGVCDTLGKLASQCPNGFCVTGDLVVELAASAPTSYTADASGNVLFGWADQGVPGLSLCPAAAPACQDAWMPDGCYDLPNKGYAASPAPVGIRVNVNNALFVPIDCAMAEPGGICASGEGCLVDADCATGPCTITTDVACPTPDASLISCPIN